MVAPRDQNGAVCIDSFLPEEGLGVLAGVEPYGFGGGAIARAAAAALGAFAVRGASAGAATGAGSATMLTDGWTSEVVVVVEVGSSEGGASTTGGGARVIVAVALVFGPSSLVPTTIASAVPSTTATPTAIVETRAARLAFRGTNVVAVLTLGPDPRATGMSCAV